MKKNIENKSKELAFLLRHDTEYQFDSHGWRKVEDLIISMIDEHEITKKAYENLIEEVFDAVELKEKMPPDILYHGTAQRFLNSILEQGILKGTRLFVHLSDNIETAEKVGMRHGKPAVICINTKQMAEDGIKFYLSANNVWLTEYVDSKYITKIINNFKI